MSMPPSETTTFPFEMTLFGPMQVLVNGQPLPRLRSRKTLWLLALLTLRANRSVPREWLAGLLWPDLDQQRATTNLRPILSELRDALGSESGRIQTPDRLTVLLDLTGAEVDVLAFDAAVKSKQITDLVQAVKRYQGPLLEGCFEEWVFQERREREQNCLQALHTLAEAASIGGDYATATDYYQQAVKIDPLGDTSRRGLMEALAQSGNRTAALQVYREFVEALRSDPNASPDEQTSALYTRLRAEARQQPPVPAQNGVKTAQKSVVTGYLPHPITGLVGREDETIEATARLRRSRLVTLTGMGGIGKTRLAMQVAEQSVEEYADGVWLVALEGLSSGDAITRQIASVLSMKEEAGRTFLQSLTERLRARRLLLVLDNCEHLLEASAQIAGHLLKECPHVRLLATSREALGVMGETVWQVPSLSVPAPEHLPEGRATLVRVLSGYESVRLFVERAQECQQGFALDGNNALAVAQVCARLQGIPLAIELAAARMRALTVEQIVARLDDHLSLLTVGNRAALPRQQTLRATLDWSYALLNEAERLLLRRLSVFVGGWTLEAAEAVGEGKDIAAHQVFDILTSLVDKSLAIFIHREGETSGRYHFLETIRQYALAKLQSSGEMEALKAKHRNWYVHLAEQADAAMNGAEQAIWLHRLEAEHDNLRATLAWEEAEAHGAETVLRLAASLWRFWDMRGHHTEGRQHLERALERDEIKADTIIRGRVLTGAGSLASRQGDYATAWARHQESLSIQRALQNRRGEAAVLGNLGSVAFELGDYKTAQALQEESLNIHRDLGNRLGIADTLSNLCNVCMHQGDYDGAKALQAESLSLRREIGDERGVAWSLESMGIIAFLQGDYAAARTLFAECLHMRRDLEDKYGIALSLNNLGCTATEEGHYPLAQSLFRESLTIFRELENKRGVVECLEGLAVVMLPTQPAEAARLRGAADALRENIAAPLPPHEREKYDTQMEQARQVLGADAFAAAWAEGRALSWKQAVSNALADL